MTTTELAIHAYALHRGPIWRSDAWAAPDHHLRIEAPAMTGIDYRIGDTRDVTATIPTGSVSLVATSPPFLALRSYLPADHPDKHAEIGSEPDPATFIDTLLGLTAEWGRVLAPWGSIAIELGDTYSGSGGGGGDYLEGGMREGQQQFSGSAATMRESNAAHWRQKAAARDAWPMAKSLALIPQLYAIALAYGRNPLTGAESPAGRWRVRNVIVWQRPNPAVGALGDKFRPSTSYIVVATRDAKRWFDLTAVRNGAEPTTRTYKPREAVQPGNTALVRGGDITDNPAGAPPLDCWFDEWDGSHDTWTITTQPSRLAHYAMWPAKLAERLVLSMCPAEVCSACGEPRRRMEGAAEYVTGRGKPAIMDLDRSRWAKVDESILAPRGISKGDSSAHRVAATVGWTDCGCGAPWTAGTVLDPFAGTFTTGLVAEYHGRNAIGIDVDARNAELVPLRREEVRRNLNPTHVRQIDNQLDLFGAAS